jgi:hypothetical protein
MNLASFEAFHKEAHTAGIIFYHTGEFSSAIISAAAEAMKHRLQESGASGPVTRKLFSTFVEMAQNIHHYASETVESNGRERPGIGTISVIKGEGEFWVLCANRIKTNQIASLSQKLDQVRSMSIEEIKKAYKEQLKNEAHSEINKESKGAGLGWLTVARDSKQPLEYCFSSDPNGDGKFAYFLAIAVI